MSDGTVIASAVPPNDLRAERAVLASLLLDASKCDAVASMIRQGDFYADLNGMLFSAIMALHSTGQAVDVVTVAAYLDSRGQLEEIGGVPYLSEVMESVPHSEHAGHYAGIVRDRSQERQLLQVCQDTTRRLIERDPTATTAAIMAEHETQLAALQDGQASIRDVPFGQAVADALGAIDVRCQTPDQIAGLSTGFAELDMLTHGLCRSQLFVLAARPSMGKTAFVCNVMDWLCQLDLSVLFVSLEQSRAEIAERIMCIRSRIDSGRLRRGLLDHGERHALLEAANELHESRLRIDDTARQTVADIAATARRTRRKFGLDAIIVDYLQIVEPEDRRQNREAQVASISRRLKQLAKDMNIPVMVLAQVNRSVDSRPGDKRPRLGDLRESGAIEADADIVAFLHRPDMYDPDAEPGVAEVIVGKNRSGRTGIAKLRWQGHSMRFEDMPTPADVSF